MVNSRSLVSFSPPRPWRRWKPRMKSAMWGWNFEPAGKTAKAQTKP
jgi:hypothetical protein